MLNSLGNSLSARPQRTPLKVQEIAPDLPLRDLVAQNAHRLPRLAICNQTVCKAASSKEGHGPGSVTDQSLSPCTHWKMPHWNVSLVWPDLRFAAEAGTSESGVKSPDFSLLMTDLKKKGKPGTEQTQYICGLGCWPGSPALM